MKILITNTNNFNYEKSKFLILVLFFLILSTNMFAQPKTGRGLFFKGKWNILIKRHTKW